MNPVDSAYARLATCAVRVADRAVSGRPHTFGELHDYQQARDAYEAAVEVDRAKNS